MLAVIEARAGRRDVALGLLARARAQTLYLPPASVANTFAALGEVDSAMTWMEKAFAERSNAIVYLAADKYNPRVQRDPRFRAMMARLGFE
jgi:hypothetical protein